MNKKEIIKRVNSLVYELEEAGIKQYKHDLKVSSIVTLASCIINQLQSTQSDAVEKIFKAGQNSLNNQGEKLYSFEDYMDNPKYYDT